MSRLTKEQLELQLDAATLRANRVTLDLAKLRAGLRAVVELASAGHLGGDSLLDALEDLAMEEGTPPFEVESEYSVHPQTAR